LELKSILVPLDFSGPSKEALACAEACARKFGAELVLLHVVEPISMSADYGYGKVHGLSPNEYLLGRCKKRLESLRRRRVDGLCGCKAVVRSGKVVDEIAKAAKELDADLIILATHGYTGLEHTLLGSTAELVVRQAPCPVLIVRQQEHDLHDGKILPSTPKGNL
jgi:nucleotide-binding universal stress UspA family protein